MARGLSTQQARKSCSWLPLFLVVSTGEQDNFWCSHCVGKMHGKSIIVNDQKRPLDQGSIFRKRDSPNQRMCVRRVFDNLLDQVGLSFNTRYQNLPASPC